MLTFFEEYQKKYNSISFVYTWNKISKSSLLSSLPRVDESKLYKTETISNAYQLKNLSVLDGIFLEEMLECKTVFLNTIDRCAAAPISIYKINTLYYELLLFFKSFFEENHNLTHVFFPATPHFAPDIVLFYVSKYFKKKTIILTRTDFDNKYIFNLDWRLPIIYEQVLNVNYINSSILNTTSNFIEHSKKLNEQSLSYNKKKINFLKKLKNYYFIFHHARYIYNNQSLYSPIYFNNDIKIVDLFRIIYNRIYINNNLYNLYRSISEKPDLSIKYIYFALHFQPERSTQPEGSFFENQLLAIRLLQSNLPKGCMIYVKEHPRQFDNDAPDLRKVHARVPEFYTQINKLLNVKLINIDFNSDQLINNAMIVATITGSTGWQALKKGKPIFIFGYPWYSSCFGTYVIRSSSDITNALVEIAKLNNQIISNEVERFINRINPYLVDGYTGINDTKGNRPNINLISKLFINKLHSFALNLKL